MSVLLHDLDIMHGTSPRRALLAAPWMSIQCKHTRLSCLLNLCLRPLDTELRKSLLLVAQHCTFITSCGSLATRIYQNFLALRQTINCMCRCISAGGGDKGGCQWCWWAAAESATSTWLGQGRTADRNCSRWLHQPCTGKCSRCVLGFGACMQLICLPTQSSPTLGVYVQQPNCTSCSAVLLLPCIVLA